MVFGFAALEAYWSSEKLVLGMLVCYLMVEQVIFICLIAQYMNLTWQKVAATQFAVYMALANLGRSAGAGLFAVLSVQVDYATIFIAVGVLYLVSIGFLLMFSERRHLLDLKNLDAVTAR